VFGRGDWYVILPNLSRNLEADFLRTRRLPQRRRRKRQRILRRVHGSRRGCTDRHGHFCGDEQHCNSRESQSDHDVHNNDSEREPDNRQHCCYGVLEHLKYFVAKLDFVAELVHHRAKLDFFAKHNFLTELDFLAEHNCIIQYTCDSVNRCGSSSG
jgi:hypothetical protein